MSFLAMALEWPARFGDFGIFKGFQGLNSCWDPKTMC